MWTSAAFACQLPPAPCATAPAPRQGGHATVATQARATVAPTRRRRSTGSYARRTPIERTASLPDFDNASDGCSTPSFPFSKPRLLWQMTTTRANWRVAKIIIPPESRCHLLTIRSTTALHCRRLCPPMNQSRAPTTMTHHPQLAARQPMGATQQPHPPLLLTGRSMGAMPLSHHLQLSTHRSMGAMLQRREMPRMLDPLAMRITPPATATGAILAYLCNKLWYWRDPYPS